MAFSLWIALLLVPAGAEAQSGDAETDAEPTMICTSHISQKVGNSITCNLSADSSGLEDDEDAESDDIENMTVWFHDRVERRIKWLEGPGNTIASPKMFPISAVFNVTVQLKRGGKISRELDLTKIVKPKSPQVWNATFHPQSNKAVIHIRSPYRDDYLKPKNQLFQFCIWSADKTLINNVTGPGRLVIGGEHLQKDTEYRVKVRAIPSAESKFEGTWSEWSAALNFSTGVVKADRPDRAEETLLYHLIGSLSVVMMLLVTWSFIFFCRKKISTYMWPSIPHPKHALVQIYTPIKGLPVSFNPELFNDLNIRPVESIEEQRVEERAPVRLSEPLGETSASSRSNTSLNTEESDLSALLSGSASGGEEEEGEEEEEREEEGEDDPRSTPLQAGAGRDTPGPERGPGGNHTEMNRVNQRGKDEAYVTMSSFYHIN